MKSAILTHSVEGINLVFFAYSNQVFAGIFKRIDLDLLNPNNVRRNSLFPITNINCFLNIFTIFQVLSIDD